MCFPAGLVLQAFAVASHACHVHLGSKPGQGQAPAALPCLRSAQTPALPSNDSVPLPQLEVRHVWTQMSALGLLCCLCSTLFLHVSFTHLAWYPFLVDTCPSKWQPTGACMHICTRKLEPCTSALQSLDPLTAVRIVPAYNFMLFWTWQGMDLSQGIAAVVPDWDSVRLLAPHAELRLLACGQASLIAPHRLRSTIVCPSMHLLSVHGICHHLSIITLLLLCNGICQDLLTNMWISHSLASGHLLSTPACIFSPTMASLICQQSPCFSYAMASVRVC